MVRVYLKHTSLPKGEYLRARSIDRQANEVQGRSGIKIGKGPLMHPMSGMIHGRSSSWAATCRRLEPLVNLDWAWCEAFDFYIKSRLDTIAICGSDTGYSFN